VARGGLAALLGADAGHEERVDPARAQPLLERAAARVGAEHRRVHLLVEHRIGSQRELGHRAHEAGGGREGICGVLTGLAVKHLHDRDAAFGCAIDQGLHIGEERRQLPGAKVRSLAEGFLDVDDEQCLIHSDSVTFRKGHMIHERP
jgi:hypothetical protein